MTHRTRETVAAILLTLVLAAAPSAAQTLQPSQVVYEGHYDVLTNGNDSAYMRGLTHRYVNGELRFLSLTHRGVLHEFRKTSSPGGTITSTTATWDLSSTGTIFDFNGIWFEQAKNRLWIVGSVDYNATNTPAKVTLLSLGANGSVTTLKSFTLDMPAKRVYGGCAAVPAALVSQIGGPYVCGWGGYTSLLLNGGGASVGATMYAIPDPDTIQNGATVSPRTVLDHFGSRGLRQTIPVNRYESNWQSPTGEGLGYQVWGDSYYNTGMWIGTSYVAVASLCKGECWYENSTLNHRERQFELHVWNGTTLGSSVTQRPSSMTELALPRANTWAPLGNVTAGNVSGATYDATTGHVYIVGYPFGAGGSSGRLFAYRVGAAGSTPPADSTSPTVSLSSPSAGSTISGTLTLGASASDNVGVAGVWFTVNGVTVGAEDATSPYQASWNTTTASNGSHTIQAVARDAAGNTTTSAPVTVTVSNGAPADTTAPTVSLSAPATGSTVSGTVAVSATAADNVGVVSVQFTLNGTNVGSPDTTAPYSINWSTTGAANGTHTLGAVARDAAGNITTAATRSVTVNNQSADTTAPTVSLSAPAASATVSGTVTVSATAADSVGVTSVQFTLNNVNLGSADTTAPYSISWSTTGAANGAHTLRAIARDAAGNVTTSTARSVTVNNQATDTTAPAVSVSAPTAGATVSGTVNVSATATDAVGVTSVQFTLDGANLGAAETAAPFTIRWNTTGATNGAHTLRAVARDAAGNVRTSNAISVTVRNAAAVASDTRSPSVSVTGPSAGSNQSGTITLTATASDDTAVASVQFVVDGQNVGSADTSSPYSISWNTATVANGAHTIQAVARDPAGNSQTSAGRSIVVANTVAAPAESATDLNGDGLPDLLLQHESGQVQGWFMNGSSRIGTRSTSPTMLSPAWKAVSLHDFSRDGKGDVLWQHKDTGQLALWVLNNTQLMIETGIAAGQHSVWRAVATGDVNGDGHTDIIWQHPTTGYTKVWLMNYWALVTEAGLSPYRADLTWRVAAMADANGDGRDDIYWQNQETGEIQVWQMAQDGRTASRTFTISSRAPSQNWQLKAVANFDNAASPDLVWQDTKTGEIRLWFMSGASLLRQATVPSDAAWRLASGF